MLISKTVIVKWATKNKQHYEQRGYAYTALGEEFVADVKDLTDCSSVVVEVACDYCGKVINVSYGKYFKAHHPIGGDACKACAIKKREKIMLKEKGVKSSFELPEVKRKSKHTMIERYGVEYSMQSKEVQEKSKQTCLEKYGHEHAMQSEGVLAKRDVTWNEKYGGHPMSTKDVQNKRIQTTLDRYGVEWITQSNSFKEESSKKCMEEYGVDNFGKVKELHQKGLLTMRKNGTLPTSEPERQLVGLLVHMYGEDACTPSKIVDYYTLDCELIIGGIKIDVEYDGLYWHCDFEDSKKRDNIRNGYMKHNGYKVLRIQSKKSIPTEEQIDKAIFELVNTDMDIIYITI